MKTLALQLQGGMSTLLVVLAALFWGLSGGIGAILLADGWDTFVLAVYRGGIGLLLVCVWLALRPARAGLGNYRLWLWSAVAGIGVAGNFSFYFISIREGSVAVAATLMYCAPVFVYLASFLLGLERATRAKAVAVVVVVLGIVLLTGVYNVDAQAITPTGVGAGLIAGLAYAVFIFGFKYAARHGSPQAVLAIAFATLVALLIAFAGVGSVMAAMNSAVWPLFLALGLLGGGLSFICYVIGLKYTAPAVASLVAMVEPVTASLFGVLVLSDNLAAVQFVGMALILVTVTSLGVSSGAR
ncbi:threonine/homoserine efflux transporter RhtA [Chromatocurvus halotolerans]|uniref:Threonine/homoserine efflux transporter RhtA n=2 Tax=Chromatocurvus halotolerans TaxID=1132028 RepID=A0A4R2KKZ6_9GAMM|nr:threonine/homoserine efflux transporter RhtA [Chromatocurvus halotolerans]